MAELGHLWLLAGKYFIIIDARDHRYKVGLLYIINCAETEHYLIVFSIFSIL